MHRPFAVAVSSHSDTTLESQSTAPNITHCSDLDTRVDGGLISLARPAAFLRSRALQDRAMCLPTAEAASEVA
jgi:hypothetical protein